MLKENELIAMRTHVDEARPWCDGTQPADSLALRVSHKWGQVRLAQMADDVTALLAEQAALKAQLHEIDQLTEDFSTPDESSDTPQWRVQLMKWALEYLQRMMQEVTR